MTIKNIILDLGGVLLNIDYQKTIDEFKDLGIDNFDTIFAQAKQEELFDLYESGQMHSEKFIQGLKDKLPDHISTQEIIDAWNAMLLDFPQERLDYLLELKKKYNTVLLSNTNPIHLEAFHKIIRENNHIDSLKPYFNEVYFSSDMKMRKPSPNIFTRVCEEQGFEPSETLFVDDTEQHVEGAKEAGLKAYHLDISKQNIVGLLNSLLT